MTSLLIIESTEPAGMHSNFLCPLGLENHLSDREKELEDIIFQTQDGTPKKNHKSIAICTSDKQF